MKMIAVYALLTGTVIGLFPQTGAARSSEGTAIGMDLKVGNGRPDPVFLPAWLSNPTDTDIELLEDFSMFTLDMPDAYPQAQAVWMAQAKSTAADRTPKGHYVDIGEADAQAVSVKPDMTLVACQPPGSNTFSPEVAVENYFYLKFKHRLDTDNAKVELVESTKKASLSYFRADDGRSRGWRYQGSTKVKEGVSNRPHGIDQGTFLVTIKNLSTGKWMNIRVIEQIGLTSIWPKNSHKYAEEDCGPIRKISANGSSTNLAAWQRSANLSALIARAQQSFSGFADLPATALGLEHSGQVGDFMNASLQPGMRKLPSGEELALMSQLVAQLQAE